MNATETRGAPAVATRKRLLPRLLLAVLGVGIALVIAEIVLRKCRPEPAAYQVWPAGMRHVFRAAPGVMPGVEGESRFTINSQGVRGEEFDDTKTDRIIAMGGSATECLFLDDTETWPHLVQENLRKRGRAGAWVGNIGRSGMTSRDHVLQMQLLVPALPRVRTIVLLAGVNDFMLRLNSAAYDPRHLDNPILARAQLKHAFSVTPPDAQGGFLEGTALWRLLVRPVAPPRPASVQDDAGRFYEDFRRRRRAAKEILTELPNLLPALDEYGRNLGRIARLAREQSVRLVFVTQPTIWKERMPEREEALLWFGGTDNFLEDSSTRYYSTAALAQGMRLYNARMTGVAKEHGIECVDLADVLPRDTTVFYDDLHLNENGARMAAELIAGRLATTGR